jgi:hypothetical protein
VATRFELATFTQKAQQKRMVGKDAAQKAAHSHTDSDADGLHVVILAWAKLPSVLKAAIVGMVRAVQ